MFIIKKSIWSTGFDFNNTDVFINLYIPFSLIIEQMLN